MSRRTPAGVAVTTAATGLFLFTLSGTASAAVGLITVQQKNASGQGVCNQVFLAALLDLGTSIDQVCSGATQATITNYTVRRRHAQAPAGSGFAGFRLHQT